MNAPEHPERARQVARVVLGVVLGVATALLINARQPHDSAAGRPEATAPPPSTTPVVPTTARPTPVTVVVAPPTTTPPVDTAADVAVTTTTVPTTTSTVAPTTTAATAAAPRSEAPPAPGTTVPTWPPYEPLPPIVGRAALTGEPADESITLRPILAVKIDNAPGARPQWGLDQADAIFEENVESTTRFVALFQTRMPERVGPVRSARTGDIDLVAAMNRPVLAWSGGNKGVTKWVESAAASGRLVDFSAQRNPCYERSSSRRSPHNLLLDPLCAVNLSTTAGRARPLWTIDADWELPAGTPALPDSTFVVGMDGVTVEWTWNATMQRYLRNQAGGPHLAMSGQQIAADTVVELYAFHQGSPVDSRTPHPITTGGTRAVVHRDGVRIEGTWYRETPLDAFRFYTAAGDPVPLDVGTTFVMLVRDR